MSAVPEFADPDPARPPSPLGIDWDAVEQWLGLPLPGDYKRLADACGPVDFGNYLWIHVPCTGEDRFDYGGWLRGVRDRATGGPPVHPDPGGLLAFGESRGGDLLFWDTSVSADPDDWTVVVRHTGAVPGSGLRTWHRYGVGLTGYLRRTVRPAEEGGAPPSAGPLPGTVARTAFLRAVRPWTPPGAAVAHRAESSGARRD